jgi:HAD superfamily hydrolase (TIGR01490 family)
MARAAFFDVDGTLWAEKSLLSFYRTYLDHEDPGSADRAWASFERDVERLQRAGVPREEQNRWFYRTRFAGLPVKRAAELARVWFAERSARSGFFLQAVMNRARSHVRQGDLVVLLTGSFREIVEPLAARIGTALMITAPLCVRSGRYTGELDGPPTIGAGKAVALAAFLDERGIDPASTFGYGDDVSDVPFLERIANPVAIVTGGVGEPAFATERGWEVLRA